MTKSKSAKRKHNVQLEVSRKQQKQPTTITPPPDATASTEPKSLVTLISDDDLEITIDTLTLLSKYPNVIKSKQCKELRVAVYDFRQACITGINTASENNLTARISAALTDGKYIEARILLAEMRIRGETPKLGALCRWVRDLDVVSGLSMQREGMSNVIDRSVKDKELLLVLDAILRVTGPTDSDTQTPIGFPQPIALRTAWNIRDSLLPYPEVYKSVIDANIFAHLAEDTKTKFKAIETTPGPLRKPPNRHPAILYSSDNNAILLSPDPPKASMHYHPNVPNLSLIKDVLSERECTAIIAAAELIGFLPDAPIQEGGGEEISVLAHNFYWLVDEAFHKRLWSRVRPYLPDYVGGKKARCLNRRFRVYRYVPGAEYRCHIDGAWPPSGIDPVTKAYVYDSSPPSAKQSSLFTFLIYLNDEFEAGETTFFMPAIRDGVMNAYPVRPVMGGVVMFRHGETAGALLHEGTGVRSGAKYVIRTDVVYDVDHIEIVNGLDSIMATRYEI